MKRKIITGFIFITLAILLFAFCVWAIIFGINSGNVNFIIGSLFGGFSIAAVIGFSIPDIILLCKGLKK